MGLATAIAAVAAGLLIASALLLVWFLRPMRSTKREIEEIESKTAEALADLPIDALAALVRKRPLLALSAGFISGYSVMRDPAGAAHTAQRIISRLV